MTIPISSIITITQIKCGGICQFLHRERAKLGFLLIDLKEIYPMQSSEFTKSLCFGSNPKKLIFQLKIYFYICKNIFGTFFFLALIDLRLIEIFPIKPSEFGIPHSIDSYDTKNC